jgi:hypothetical protein
VNEKKVIPDALLRNQWLGNDGYCGEMSLISAGLYYGQYLSQYDVRAAGNGANAQLSQLILEPSSDAKSNILQAAANLGLIASLHTDSDPTSFLTWVKGELIAGHPVIIGVYENCNLFEVDLPGDNDYDHIVIVTGFHSNHDLTDGNYYSDDVLTFWDHGLWTGDPVASQTFSSFDSFPNTRSKANSGDNLYSLPLGVTTYGVSISGVTDPSAARLTATVSATDELEVIKDMGWDGESPPPAQPPRPARSSPMSISINYVGLSPTFTLFKYTALDGNNTLDPASKVLVAQLPTTSGYVDTIVADPVPTTSSIYVYRAVIP